MAQGPDRVPAAMLEVETLPLRTAAQVRAPSAHLRRHNQAVAHKASLEIISLESPTRFVVLWLPGALLGADDPGGGP